MGPIELIIILYTFLAWAGVGMVVSFAGLVVILIIYLVAADVPDPKG